EGTELSEGRGTTRPLEQFGAPGLDVPALLHAMERLAPEWMQGCRVRPCFFQPTFHKHVGTLCAGVQLHVDDGAYRHDPLKLHRFVALWVKAIGNWRRDSPLWRDFVYEYEPGRRPIDVIDGGPRLREWVDDPQATAADFDALLSADERAWTAERQPYLLY